MSVCSWNIDSTNYYRLPISLLKCLITYLKELYISVLGSELWAKVLATTVFVVFQMPWDGHTKCLEGIDLFKLYEKPMQRAEF